MKRKPQILFLSHGGGPMPLLGDTGHREMVETLKTITTKLRKPSAILVISAHWEEALPTVTSAGQPSLIYDYYGFPPAAYEITYPCPGEPALAQEIHKCLTGSGMACDLSAKRGFDHGLFIPLKIMYPSADIPCVQLSLQNSLNPAEHIALGEALQRLDYDDLLVIGSGFSFHNMKAFFSPTTNEIRSLNEAFEAWLQDTLTNKTFTEEQRKETLVAWEDAPGARFCHPREEHLLPLHVCYGLARSACSEALSLDILNKKSSMYLWL